MTALDQSDPSRVIVVTGASRGIGAAIANLFSDRGDRVVGVSRSLQSSPKFAAYFECDVADRDSVRSVIDEVSKRFGKIDVLINNAGLAGENSLDSQDDDSLWHDILNVNLNGTYYFSKYALPLMSKGGSIVNIASVLGLFGVPDQTAYCAAKHAVVGFTRSLALNLAQRRIRVNAICPGWTRTEMAEGRFRELGVTANEIGEKIPLGRIVEPVEVAKLAYFVCSNDAIMMTGQTLTLDGGAS